MLTAVLIIVPVLLSGLTFIMVLKIAPFILNFPLDFNKTYRGKRIFGKNKTLKGPVIMSLFTGLYGSLFFYLYKMPEISNVFWSYAAIGLLYSLGELPNSFIKRQLDINPGEAANENPRKILFRLLDIYDSLIFCWLGYIIIFGFDPLTTTIVIISSGGLHVGTDLLMKLLALKQ